MLVYNCLIIKLRSSVFVGENEVVTSRLKTVAVAVVVWKQLLQDVMLVVPDPFKQTFVGILNELSRSRVTVATEPSRTPRWTNAAMCCLSEDVANLLPGGEAYSNLANTAMCFSALLHIP